MTDSVREKFKEALLSRLPMALPRRLITAAVLVLDPDNRRK